MPGIHREGDSTAGHGCWPPTEPASYSGNVFANGKKIVRNGDTIIPHTCPSIPETHGGVYVGSHNVYVNSRDVQTCGDPVDCGDIAASCSGNVKVN